MPYSGDGFEWSNDGTKVIDIGNGEELTILEFDHSIYGLIRYVLYDFGEGEKEYAVQHSYEDSVDDWQEELP